MSDRQKISLLSENGDGTGATGLDVDGSGTPVWRLIAVPSWADHLKVDRLRIYGQDAGPTDAEDSFLNLDQTPPAALANGLEVGLYDAGPTLALDLMAGLGVAKNNADFIGAGWNYEEITYAAGDSAVYVERIFTTPLVVPKGMSLAVKIQDDLSAFTNALAAYMGLFE